MCRFYLRQVGFKLVILVHFQTKKQSNEGALFYWRGLQRVTSLLFVPGRCILLEVVQEGNHYGYGLCSFYIYIPTHYISLYICTRFFLYIYINSFSQCPTSKTLQYTLYGCIHEKNWDIMTDTDNYRIVPVYMCSSDWQPTSPLPSPPSSTL